MKFNKGEWSELYAILYLSVNPNLKIVDENLKILDSNIFKILEMIFDDKKLEINTNELIKIKMSKKRDF